MTIVKGRVLLYLAFISLIVGMTFGIALSKSGENLALRSGVIATASGYVNSSETPDMARDGNTTTTKWCDNVTTRDKWLKYDLGANCDINTFILNWEDWDKNSKYKIQKSSDGISWTDVVNETGNSSDPREYAVSLTGVRYVRFFVSQADDDCVRLMEFEVWGTVSGGGGSSGDDEFSSSTLGSQWSWIRQDSANWSLTARAGYMRLICTATDIYGTSNNTKNILLQTAPTGDWSIVAKLDGKPSSNWAQGGLIVYQNDDNYIKVSRLFDSANGNNIFQFTKEAGATPTNQNTVDSIGSTISYLKITKSGNNYSGYYSADGVNFTQIGTSQAVTLSTIKVGLVCMAGTGLNGDFDYFHIITGSPTPAPSSTPTPSSTPSSTRTPTPTSTPTSAWVLTWSDEFNGTGAPDPNKWDRPSYNRRNNPSGPDGWWDPNEVYLDGAGNCVIRVEKVADRNGDGDAYDYAVGAIRTYGKFTQTYGRFECRVQMPTKQGWWVAFWMMQGNQGSIGNGGVDGSEVDIMEGWGWTDKINHAIHWDGYGASHQSVGSNEVISGIRSGYHTFTLDWMPDIYIFYVDGVEKWRSTGGGICNQPGYIKVTGEISTEAWAITDSWSRDPAGATYPDYYKIDYVRVYKRQ